MIRNRFKVILEKFQFSSVNLVIQKEKKSFHFIKKKNRSILFLYKNELNFQIVIIDEYQQYFLVLRHDTSYIISSGKREKEIQRTCCFKLFLSRDIVCCAGTYYSKVNNVNVCANRYFKHKYLVISTIQLINETIFLFLRYASKSIQLIFVLYT